MSDLSFEEEAEVGRSLAELRAVLIPGETLDTWAIQRRLYALTHRRLVLAATSGRLIVLTRKLLGGFEVASIRWQDLEEVTLSVGMLSADLGLRAGRATDFASLGAQGSQRLEFHGLRRGQAQALYRICQAQEQAWREKRRVRELEELRARAGGIQVTTAPAGDADALRRLNEARRLLESRLITDAEYEAIKAKIVSSP
jgi:hypothetical protein